MTAASEKRVLHGGDLDAARARYPAAPEPWIDLSTGINPWAFPLPAIPAEAWTRLPLASEEAALREAAASRYGAADPACVVAAAGSQALIQALPRLVSRARVAVLGPAYAEHAAAWTREGHDVREVNDPGEEAADVLIVVTPNNPTGYTIARADLVRLAETSAKRGGLLIVDEAFMDVASPDESLVPALPSSAIVLRSVGKAYGLAGMRLGFAIAEREIAARLAALLGPWAVSGPAIDAGRAALADTRWLEETRTRLERDVARLDALLTRAGCRVLGGMPLFCLVHHERAAHLADVLGERGIHVRTFPEHPLWLRFGLPGPEAAWERLAKALDAA